MAQLLHLSDALRCLLGGTVQGTNRAFSRAWLAGQRGWLPLSLALARESMDPRTDHASWIAWQGTFRYSLASACARATPRVWEVHRLYAVQGGTSGELLEALTAHAGQQGAERLFLRMVEGDPLAAEVRASQFLPSFSEVLLVGEGRSSPPQKPGPFRPREARDEHAIFQLYSAATPTAVRQSLGMTLDQWRDASECHPRQREEWVAEQDGKLCVWAALDWRGRGYDARLMVHPGCPELLPQTVERALRRSARYTWLVPEYQEPLVRLLTARGFREAGRYTMLMKATAARVKHPSLAPVEA